jgi:hypothetical protein
MILLVVTRVKMDVISASEILVMTYKTTPHYILENFTLLLLWELQVLDNMSLL